MGRKQKISVIIATVATLAVCCALLYRVYSRPVKEDAIYVHGFVYDKQTGQLFSGTVKGGDAKHWGTYSFRDGAPYGHFESRDFGDITSEGKYVDESKIPVALRNIIGSDLFWISFWNEGPFTPDEPDFLEIQILDTNYLTSQVKSQQQIDQIANGLAKSMSREKYNYSYIFVVYTSDFYIYQRYWKSYEYEMKDAIPVFNREYTKPGTP